MTAAAMLIAGVVVLVTIAFVARGGGGELSAERGDYAPLDMGLVSATDVALLRPPTAMWGYDMRATNEAMERIAESIKERDVRIAALEQLVTDLGREPAPQALGSPYAAARHRRVVPDADAGLLADACSRADAGSPAVAGSCADPASSEDAGSLADPASSEDAGSAAGTVDQSPWSARAGLPGGDGMVPPEQSHD